VASSRYPIQTILGVAIAAILSLYSVFETYSEQADRNKAAADSYHMEIQQKRFEALKPELQGVAVAGYFSDMDSVPGVFLAAEYALAPTVLADERHNEWVVGDFYKPTDYAEFGRAHNFTVVKDFSQGVVLFRRIAK
jgi:hypothetical protein